VADAGVATRVSDTVAPLLAERGLDLFDVVVAGATVQVFVDREGGIDLDTLAEVTRLVSAELDRIDPIPGRYTLEVSSPGLERALRTPAHFRRFVGTDVSVKTRVDVDGERRFDGVLAAADDSAIVVAIDGVEHRLAYDDIDRARTRFSWGPGPKPGSASKKKASTKS
jgi:ribosome maturation factor RimP